jgi:hypothetical protein
MEDTVKSVLGLAHLARQREWWQRPSIRGTGMRLGLSRCFRDWRRCPTRQMPLGTEGIKLARYIWDKSTHVGS